MPSETSTYCVGLNHLPAGPNGAWLAVPSSGDGPQRAVALDLRRIGLGEQLVTTKTLRRRSSPWPDDAHPARARRLTLHLPQGWPWENQFSRPALARFRALPLPNSPDGARSPLTQLPRQLAARAGPRVLLAVSYPAISLTTAIEAAIDPQ